MINQTSETTLVQGTVAASAVHVATVATGAFAFIDAIDLSPYVGCKLTLRNSSGRTAVGYVMRAGTGLALDPNAFLTPDFSADTNWTKGLGWGIGANVATHSAGIGGGVLSQDIATVGHLYKISVTVSGWSAGDINTVTPTVLSIGTAGNGAKSAYRTQTSGTTIGFYAGTAAAYNLDDASLERVTEPPVTGVVIASAKGGAVQSWAATTTGFDPNAVTFYSISRVHVATVVASGNLGAGDGGLVLTDGSAKAVPTGVDISGYAGGYYFLTFQDTGGRVYGGYSGSVSDGTGLTIVTAKAGATQNWLIKTASFDKDVALAYKVCHVGY